MWKEQEGERRNEGKKIEKEGKTRNLYWASTFVTQFLIYILDAQDLSLLFNIFLLKIRLNLIFNDNFFLI